MLAGGEAKGSHDLYLHLSNILEEYNNKQDGPGKTI
jgi:hypothetical protein